MRCFHKIHAFFLFSILFSLCYLIQNIAHADRLDTKLSRDKVNLGETVTLLFNTNNATTSGSPDFSPLAKDFNILGTSRNTVINIINGATRAQTLWQVTVEPKTAGELLIPEISFGMDKSAPLKLIVGEGIASTRNNQQNISAFVKAELNTNSPYVQSQVLYTFKLFYRTQFDNPIIEPPQIENGILAEVGEDKYYQTTIKGEQFLVFEKNFAIFPQKPGKLIIPPTRFRASQFEINSNIMYDPFSMPTSKPVTLKTQALTLNVQKTPETFQGKVWLPAKNIALSQQWSSDPNRWETGNPITRTITIKTEGLRADQIPDLIVDNIPGVNIYADPPHRSNSVEGNLVVGTWQQKITYIPNLTQSFIIPALQLNWWNTQTNTNALAELKSINVQVQGKVNNLRATPANVAPIATPLPETKPATNQLPQNPLPMNVAQIKTLTNQGMPFYLSIWFWISIFLLLAWLISLWWVWKRQMPQTTVNTIITKNNPPKIATKQPSNKKFAQACEQGDADLAQKCLLLWAKAEWQDPPLNLGKLRDMVSDENFKKALENLEQSLYADEKRQWNGQALLAAYQQVQKQQTYRHKMRGKDKKVTKNRSGDPLPPLYP